MSKQSNIKEALEEIKLFAEMWMTASGLDKEEFLKFRTCKKFKFVIDEMVVDKISGIGVFLTYEEGLVIGLPFFIGYEHSLSDKEQYFLNTPLILTYLANLLDKANKEEPINGSYVNSYFGDKTRRFLPKLMELKKNFME